ncbi:hypothetical protein [Aurantimonas sp. A3-2-R12]|uniref:hypothetical protein n=1 Tax=Aurantimonas sp. A3-2-R12 TaxID=3114362 RepID=UPI002E174AB1|nr:hypothetical protein [Aurantimonas sp. A3-2-R12]
MIMSVSPVDRDSRSTASCHVAAMCQYLLKEEPTMLRISVIAGALLLAGPAWADLTAEAVEDWSYEFCGEKAGTNVVALHGLEYPDARDSLRKMGWEPIINTHPFELDQSRSPGAGAELDTCSADGYCRMNMLSSNEKDVLRIITYGGDVESIFLVCRPTV